MQVQGFAPTEAGFALSLLVVTASILSRYFCKLAGRTSSRAGRTRTAT